jgi:DNA repair exonuclease SbcCD nuclease subunit
MKIYQVADVHLGRRRLDGRLPDRDFAEAFEFVADAAIADQADVLLIVGDLFDRAQVEPAHLQQAQAVLRKLRAAGVAVIAVEGNHDRQSLHSPGQTWVQFLGDEDLLTLLRPRFDADGAVLEPWDPASRRGAFVDAGGVRFVGAGYLGAATPARVRQILARLDPARRHVLLLHAGPDYFVGEGGGFSKDDLQGLADAVCYLALGHIHKPMIHGDWACNPGSLEHCELREAASDRPGGKGTARGYAVVDLDPARARPTRIEIRAIPRRPVHHVDLDCTPFGNKTKHGADSLIEAAIEAISAASPTPDAVIDLWLTGRLNLNRVALDQAAAADTIAARAGVLAVAIDTTRLNVGFIGAGSGSAADADLPRDELERRAIQQLVDGEPLWGLDGERGQFADFLYELKETVREGKTVEEIAGKVATSPLVELIRWSKSGAAAPPNAKACDEAEVVS